MSTVLWNRNSAEALAHESIDSSRIDAEINNYINEEKLPSIGLLKHARTFFDDQTVGFRPSVAVKQQLINAACSQCLDNGEISLFKYFNYTMLNSCDLACLFRILNSYQLEEKQNNPKNPIFPTIALGLELYLTTLFDTEPGNAHQVLDALVAYNDPNLTTTIEKMRLKIQGYSDLATSNADHNDKQAIFTLLPMEVISKIVVLVGNPALTSLLCKRFRIATHEASKEFLLPFKEVRILYLQERLLQNTLPYQKLGEVYKIFMTVSSNTIPNFTRGFALLRIQSIEKLRKEHEDRQLIADCKNLPLDLLNDLYQKADSTYQFLDESPLPRADNVHEALEILQGTWHPDLIYDLNAQITLLLPQLQAAVGDVAMEMLLNLYIEKNATRNQMLVAEFRAKYFQSLDETGKAEHLRKRSLENKTLASITKISNEENQNFIIFVKSPLIRYFKNLTEISVPHYQNVTSLPMEIGELRQLETLNLRSTGITQLPKSIGSLKNLKFLNISITMVKDLPDEIEGLTALTTLDIASTMMLYLPIEKLKKLPELKECFFQNNWVSEKQKKEIEAHFASKVNRKTFEKIPAPLSNN